MGEELVPYLATTTIASIALLGFSRFERATFESFFRVASEWTHSYAHVAGVDDADYVMADAAAAALWRTWVASPTGEVSRSDSRSTLVGLRS
jgi:hypothetical protein